MDVYRGPFFSNIQVSVGFSELFRVTIRNTGLGVREPQVYQKEGFRASNNKPFVR